jgi:hypothetical protein
MKTWQIVLLLLLAAVLIVLAISQLDWATVLERLRDPGHHTYGS